MKSVMLLVAAAVDHLLSVVDARRRGDSLTIDAASPLSSVYDSASDTNHSPLSVTDQSGV